MRLDDVKYGVVYFETSRRQFGQVVTCDPDDGASLLFEPLDDYGDIMGGDIYRVEAYRLSPATEDLWNETFTIPGALSFSAMCGAQ
jgi:hypothetical protein